MEKGYLVTAGLKKATTWGTPVAVGALDGFLFDSIDANAKRDYIRDTSMGHGQRTQLPGYAGNYSLGAGLQMPLRYGGMNIKRFIAAIMGTSGGVPATVDTTGKQTTLKMKRDLSGIIWTLAYEIDKDNEVFEYTTIKIVGLTLSGEQGKALSLAIKYVAHSLNQNTSSGTNTTTTIDTITLPTDGVEEVLFSQAQLLMNAQNGAGFTLPSGGVLNDGHVIEAFSLDIDGKFRAEKYNTEYGDRTAEPQQEDFTEIKLNLKFSEYGAGNRGKQTLVDQLAKSQKKAKLTLTSPNLAGSATQKYQHTLWMPRLVFEDGAPGVADKGEPKWDATAVLHHVDTIPTGFTSGYLDALTCEIFDKDAADCLA